MIAFLFRRLLHALAMVAVATIVSFVLLRLAPGAPAIPLLEGRVATDTERAAFRVRQGLDRSIAAQLASYTGRAARGDFGVSLVEARPVTAVLADAIPATLLLSCSALCLAVLLGVTVGSVQGWRPDDPFSAWIGAALISLYAVPEVVLALVLLAIFGLTLGMFPVGGMADPLVDLAGGAGERFRDKLWHLVLPASTLALAWGAAIARQQREAMREIAREHFVRTARAKGVRAGSIWLRHAMRPALPTTVALIGTMLPVLAGGTVVVEALFAWPGMGSLIVRAVSLRDYPLVAGAVLLVATSVAIGTFCADAIVRLLDPRVADATRS